MVKVKLKNGKELTYEQATQVEYRDGSAILYATAPGFGGYSAGNILVYQEQKAVVAIVQVSETVCVNVVDPTVIGH